MKKSLLASLISVILIFLAAFPVLSVAAENSETVPPVPTKGTVTMVDLGAKKCIPCKMMAPILEELKKEYEGKASIIFIDVWQHQEQGQKFGVTAIPTQIFYDKNGKETWRHTGFLDKKSIIAKLKELGIEHPTP